MKIVFDTRQLQGVGKGLRSSSKRLRFDNQIAYDIAIDIVKHSRDKAPYKSGKLRRSVNYSINKKQRRIRVFFSAKNPKDKFDYAFWTHEKHYKAKHSGTGRRYLIKAYEENKLKYLKWLNNRGLDIVLTEISKNLKSF